MSDWDAAIKRAHWKKDRTESFQNSRLTKESTENALKTNFKPFSHYFPSNLCMTKAQMTNVWTLVTMTMHEFKNHLLYDCVCRLTIADTLRHTHTHTLYTHRTLGHACVLCIAYSMHTYTKWQIHLHWFRAMETIKLHIFLGSKIPLKCDCQKHFNRPFIIIIFFSRIWLFASLCVCSAR